MSCNNNNIFVEFLKEWLSSDPEARAKVKSLYQAAFGGSGEQIDTIIAMYKEQFKTRFAALHEPDLCNTSQMLTCIGAALDGTR